MNAPVTKLEPVSQNHAIVQGKIVESRDWESDNGSGYVTKADEMLAHAKGEKAKQAMQESQIYHRDRAAHLPGSHVH